MNQFLTTILFLHVSFFASAQNLIQNSSFEGSEGAPDCSGWYDGCGIALNYLCSDIPLHCYIDLAEESPSPSQEENWSLRMRAGFLQEAYAETYITGQSGTQEYEISYWQKAPAWSGHVAIGLLQQGEFQLSKEHLVEGHNDWQFISFRDTLSTQAGDTIVLRLIGGLGDFCLCTTWYDQIRVETVSVSSTQHSTQTAMLRVYPNPVQQVLMFDAPDFSCPSCTLVLYEAHGREISRQALSRLPHAQDVSHLPSGMYFYGLIRPDGLRLEQGRFVKQ